MIRLLLVPLLVLLAAAESDNRPAPEEVASGLEGAEGPVWMPGGYLLFSDTRAEKIYKLVPGQKPIVFRAPSLGANGNAVDLQGRLYTCEYKSRRVTRTDRAGTVEVIAEKYDGKRLNAPNDVVVRKDGHVFFTDPLFTPLDSRELNFYGVYHIAPAGTIDLVARWDTRPNGVTLSPDGKVLYVANTDEKSIHAFSVDENGHASNGRLLIRDLPGGPDGLKTDEKGTLYIASSGIQIYSPQGERVGSIPVPGGARNLAFGDHDFRTLFITGRTSVWRVRLAVRGARP